MFSKVLQPCRYFAGAGARALWLLAPKTPVKQSCRAMWGIPPSQYDMALPAKLNPLYVVKVYWEIIPLFVTNTIAVAVLAFSIIWACRNKVDVVFTTHNRENISRTMDLRNPTYHKLVIINQRYEAWPEMQDVLDKMTTAEKRAQSRMMSCGQ